MNILGNFISFLGMCIGFFGMMLHYRDYYRRAVPFYRIALIVIIVGQLIPNG